MKEVILTKNKIALIDDEDYARISKHSWCGLEIVTVPGETRIQTKQK